MKSHSNALKEFNRQSDIFPSLIPLRGKVPLEEGWEYWSENTRFYDEKDFIGCNAGIPGGPANNVIILDIDDHEKFDAWLKKNGHELRIDTRMHLTGNGGKHFFYQYPNNGKRYGNRVLKSEGFDIKGIGGQVVAPGSIHPDTGKPYKVAFELPIIEAPAWLLDLSLQEDQSEKVCHNDKSTTSKFNIESLPYPIKNLIKNGVPKGERSEAIYSVLNALAKVGASDPTIISIFESEAIGEKFKEKGNTRNTWLLKQYFKVKGAQKGPGSEGLTQKIKEYIDTIDGVFWVRELCADLGLASPKQKSHARVTLNRLKSNGIIEQYKNQAGCFRKIADECIKMDLANADVEETDIWLPFNIHKIVEILPGNIITVAGDANAGKTGFLLNVAKNNIHNFAVQYFSSEMGSSELRKRLELFGDFPITHENFNAYERSDDFADIIRPGKENLNIVDYLEITTEHWLVAKYLKDIHSKLNGAVAIVALQKKHPDLDDAVGGKRALEKPRLALTMFHNRLKILKAKNWQTSKNPNGKEIHFKLVSGCKFITQGEWK